MSLNRRVVVSSLVGLAAVGGGAFWLTRADKQAAMSAPVAPPAAAGPTPTPTPTPAPTPAPVAAGGDVRETVRAIGADSAPVTVTEFFSLTCSHCAAFAREVFPDIKAKLIDTGRVRWVFADYPLDRIALSATMVARSLPPDMYEPFVMALFQSQMRWAFNSTIDPIDALAKEAALAGMPRDQFDKVIGDTDLQNFVMKERSDATAKYNIDSTPTFVVKGPKGEQQKAGEMSYDLFTQFIASVS